MAPVGALPEVLAGGGGGGTTGAVRRSSGITEASRVIGLGWASAISWRTPSAIDASK